MSSPAPVRVLFLEYRYGPPAPEGSVLGSRFELLGQVFSGDVIAPSRAGASEEGASNEPAPKSPSVRHWGQLRFTPAPPSRLPRSLRAVGEIIGYLRTAQRLLGSGERYEVVVAVGLFKSAIAGLVLARLSGMKLIVEVSVVPRKIALFHSEGLTLRAALKARFLDAVAGAILRRADHVKAVFPGHLTLISESLHTIPHSAFPNFVPVAAIGPSQGDDFVLLIGTPLYLKGADLAVRAFQTLTSTIPNQRLVIVGSARGFGPLSRLIRPGDPIELVDFVPAAVALDYIRRAKVVIIPSRTDAMPRVAIEAMAAGKVVVAARVDGIPKYLCDGSNSLLCEPEDHVDLASKLASLLVDEGLRRRLGAQAREDAREHFSEARYLERFEGMVRDCLAGRPGRDFRYR